MEVHTTLQSTQQTLTSNGIEEDKPVNGPIPPLFVDTGDGFTNTEQVTSSVINTVDDVNGSSTAIAGTTADPNATAIIRVNGQAIGAITNPQAVTYPPVFNDARVAPPIKGPDNQGVFPNGHIPVPTIP